ncbi:MAG: cis-prenyltransferase [Chrysothrix sp. TS-e1954]|nr:MAG: cis-prenyltransferase [Chrysothrix sp. TS-e1954]
MSTLSTLLLRSPPAEYLLNHLRTLLLGALRCGPIPRHIAFVMDGNRRYARAHNLETVEGHHMGFEAMARILEICYKSGVQTVTIYAFSIENFKRSRGEVDGLMDMARVKLVQLAQHGELFERFGARVRILGQRELLRGDVAEAMDEAVRLTRGNRRAVLNVCFPYTSRDEITTAVRRTVAEYCEPLPDEKGRRRRPVLFSQERIARNVRARRLSTLREESSSRSPASREHAALTNGDNNVASGDVSTTDSQTMTVNGDSAPHLTNGTTTDTDLPLIFPSASSNTSSASSSSATLIHETPPSRTPSPTPTTTQTHLTPHPSHPSSTTTAASPLHPLPDPESITTHTLSAHTFTSTSPPLDLLIRTSGVERLSDFMLWQCHQRTSIVFVECLWPEFDLWSFLPVLAEWQWWRLRGGPLGVEPSSGEAVFNEEEDVTVTKDGKGRGLVGWAEEVGGWLFGVDGGGGQGNVKKLR